MSILLTIVHVIVCFTLILVILLQAGRGQGLTGPAFGGGNVQSLFGTRAGDFLTKATTVAAICFLLTSIGLDYIEVQKSRSLLDLRRPTSPLDIDAIKQALEKVKSEELDSEGSLESDPLASELEAKISEQVSEMSQEGMPNDPENVIPES